MARPREFDQGEALERAMHVFWAHGYEGTSLGALTEAMGISKSSFYETFGSKHALFLASLDHYRDTVIGRLAAHLAQAKSPRAGIEAGFALALEAAIEEGDRRGCFIGNCAIDVPADDRAASARVAAGMARIEDAFAAAVQRAQTAGEIPTGRDARALARFLTSSLNGLRVMARATRDRAVLQDIVRVTLRALDA